MKIDTAVSPQALRLPESTAARPTSQVWAPLLVLGSITLTASADLLGAEPERAVSGAGLTKANGDHLAATRLNGEAEPVFRPRTELARRLWEIRQRIIASGVPLLTADEVAAEVRRRRGGWSAHEP